MRTPRTTAASTGPSQNAAATFTTMVDHVALGVMGRLTDLSVLLVEAGGAESVEDAEAFRITRIPVDALEERVRSVSI